MAHIEKRGPKRYRARYVDPSGKECSRTFARKVDAERFLTAMESDKLRGAYVDPNAGRVTFGSVADKAMALQVSRPSTRATRAHYLDKHLRPVFGRREIGTIRKSDVRAFIGDLSARLKPQTVRGIANTLSLVFRNALDDRLIAVNPCVGVPLPKIARGQVVPPAVDDVYAVAETMAPRLRAAVTVLAGSGLRIGELLGLEVSKVDFLRRELRVDQQLLQTGEVGPPKTSASVRTVPLGQVVLDVLAAHLAAYPSASYVFTTSDGAPVPYRAWRAAWDKACKQAGVSLGTHDLRHFFASALIAGGASVKQVQTALGHNSAAMTLDVYSHLWPGDDDRTRTVIDAALRRGAETETGSSDGLATA
jgi:integrase